MADNMNDKLGNNLLRADECIEGEDALQELCCPNPDLEQTNFHFAKGETRFKVAPVQRSRAHTYPELGDLEPQSQPSIEKDLKSQCAKTQGKPLDMQNSMATLNRRRYSGSVIDKLVSFVADLIKLLELKLFAKLNANKNKAPPKVVLPSDLEAAMGPQAKKRRRLGKKKFEDNDNPTPPCAK